MIDISRLQQLMGNDKSMVNKFLGIFKSEVPRQLEQIKVHLKNSDWEQVSITAHAIKSQSNYLNLEALSNLAFTIEKNSETCHQLDLIPGQVIRLEALARSILDDDLFKDI